MFIAALAKAPRSWFALYLINSVRQMHFEGPELKMNLREVWRQRLGWEKKFIGINTCLARELNMVLLGEWRER